MRTIYHKPVMLEEAIQGLKINPDGVYVDVTFGGWSFQSYTSKTIPKRKIIGFRSRRGCTAKSYF